ncbi:hypothetical protein AVEN_179432-1 [Araneus ventricosus]|uniref:Uncharacterized protein n=1 Tax=Araneus ventricosus TaxID=182803 RepID=A0A4Y2BG32_ARAVE|nr:hypothetical protein AVEN_179432-1 [Araneus ventricosus]
MDHTVEVKLSKKGNISSLSYGQIKQSSMAVNLMFSPADKMPPCCVRLTESQIWELYVLVTPDVDFLREQNKCTDRNTNKCSTEPRGDEENSSSFSTWVLYN